MFTMKTWLPRLLAPIALLLSGCGPGEAPERVVIQYDNIPNYANWGGVVEAYYQRTGVRIPADMKASSVALAAIEAERDNPRADCAYYSGAIGYLAAAKGLHAAYKPAGWNRIPANLKAPDGTWWTVHTAHLALLVNTDALDGKPVPRSFADLLKPMYKGLVVYDDPRATGTGFTFVAGINQVLGGGENMNRGFDYLKALDDNVLKYPQENSYNELLRGEIAIWINADGNGLQARHADGAPVETVIPAEGTIAMPLVMGMVKDGPHPQATRKYLSWLLTDEAQMLFARAFFRPVTDVELPPDLAAKFPPAQAYAKAIVPPLDEMAARAGAIKARWEKKIYAAQ